MAVFKEIFSHCSDLVYRKIEIEGRQAYVIYLDGLIKTEDLQNHVIDEVLARKQVGQLSVEKVEEEIVTVSAVKDQSYLEDAANDILEGNAVLTIDGHNKGIVFSIPGYKTRGVSEPDSEAAIRGPREGFIESLRVNTSLVRRKIKTTNLKIESMKIGVQTQTNIGIAYIDGIVDKNVLKELKHRLDRIDIDGILETGYIEELIEDNSWSIFPQIQITERPDTAAANLLEGRVAIFVDGTPFVMILPSTFWQQFQASEDYYDRVYIAIFLRVLRLMFVAVALMLPAFYVAVTTYHQEMIPTNLLLSVAAARESIPFPAIVEAFIMELSFEALREAGVRLPKTIGQAVSILGALVIGTAAVEAGIVSAPMVIIVSLTGIASFTIPKFSLAIAIRLLRFPLMILASIFGLFGIVVGMVILLIHLCKLRSFGVPYFEPVAPLRFSELKDVFIRTPIWMQNSRPDDFVKENKKRQANDLKPSPNKNEG
ncbi:spore germination protein [Bacillus sp. YZJH907-2]|uniref:Spore germination protein n=1 Tax=Halalkalibacter suaedae TaxID=2822140 RepID=A0A940X0L5_9BACI|nr:spore germination protein [Bacillus suaedae]